MSQNIINTRIRGIQNQMRNVQRIVSTPKGIFESVDDVIKEFRSTNQSTLSGFKGFKGLIK